MRLFIASCVIFAGLVVDVPLTSAFNSALSPPASPPRKCEIQQKAWCIFQDGSEITDHQKVNRNDADDHVWSLRDVNHPSSVLIILEPSGCRQGFSDEVSALGFEESVRWRGKSWDKIRIGLRADGTCDLTLLVPLYDGDPLEWAFSVGRGLIAACRDDKCANIAPTPADVTDMYGRQFRRESKR